jgi:hypothetical protein
MLHPFHVPWVKTYFCEAFGSLNGSLGSKYLIFIENLKDVIQYGDNDTGLKTSVGHVIAFVRPHDGWTRRCQLC